MDFADKKLTCRDCNSEFLFTIGEQGFYLEKGLLNEPQRCPDCRANRRRDRTASVTSKEATIIVCASCGREASVPFVPKLDRPVYCNDCFSTQRATPRDAVRA